MGSCVKIRGKKREICSGDLDRTIALQVRSLKAPTGGSVDFTEEFTLLDNVPALIETTSGVEVFDGVNIKGTATHKIYIRYIADVTFENWIEFKSIKYRILDTQNLDERDEWYLFLCNLKGDASLAANFT